MNVIKGLMLKTLLVCAVVAATASGGMAQISGTLYKKDGGQASGNIRYIPSRKIYEITTGAGGAGNISIQIPERDVVRKDIVMPKEFDKASKMVSTKQYAQAIPLLKQVVSTYSGMQWDEAALGLLGECLLNTGQTKEAVDIISKAVEKGSQGISAQVFSLYLEALMKNKDFNRLEAAINSIIESGAREAAAAAQIKRGDMLKEKGKVREALVDGYLRTVLLFAEVKEVRPEAVYKALKAFEDLGQMSYAEKMRKILLVDFPNDPYTAKVQKGT